MATGFIYVLVNPAMPGLVKIGMTTRGTAERAAELSSATGVAAPFIVVFEQAFADCERAEQFVHAVFESQGVRAGHNREFFRCAPNDAIRVILQAPGLLECGGASTSNNNEDNENEKKLYKNKSGEHSEHNSEFSSGISSGFISKDLHYEAECHYLGAGNYVEDEAEALDIYKQAARLGSLHAYQRIAKIYRNNNGLQPDPSKVMQFLKEGIRHGNYCCYIDMAEFYEDSDRYGDAEKCYRSFFFEYDKGNGRILSDMEYESSIGDQYFWACINYIRRGVEHNWDIKLFEGMRPMARDILEFFNKDLLNRNPTDSRSTVRSEYDTVRGARDWVAANLFRVQMPATRGLPNVSPLTGSDRLAEPTKPRRNWWRW